MNKPNVDVLVGGPSQTTNCTYKTIVLKNGFSFASQVTEENTKFVIKWDFDLNGETVTIPENCILEFDGGTLKNGTIIGQDTVFNNMGDLDNIFGEGITKEGTWVDHFAGGGGQSPQKQADWNQDDENQPDYIKNKPDISEDVDKPYDPEHFSGLGRKTLKLKGDSNILRQSDFDQEYTVYIISHDFSLNCNSITIPQGCVLKFEGGSLRFGTLIGNHTDISADIVELFKEDIIIEGIWDVDEIYDVWFAYTRSEGVAKNQVIHNILNLTNDNVYSKIHFIRDTEYLVGLDIVDPQYTGGELQNVVYYCYKDRQAGGLGYELLDMNPLLDQITLFRISSNTDIELNSNITMIRYAEGAYNMFFLKQKHNINIFGNGIIRGDNYGIENKHDYTTLPIGDGTFKGEWGYIFTVYGCDNISFRDITLSGAFGDAIVLDPDVHNEDSTQLTTDAVPCSNINIENVKIFYCRRNGISLAAENVFISNCHFEGNGIDEIYGTAPMAAIDFECDYLNTVLVGEHIYPYVGNKNVVMDNCNFVNNAYDISSSSPVPEINKDRTPYLGLGVIVRNCKLNMLRLNDVDLNSPAYDYLPWTKSRSPRRNSGKNLIFENCEVFGITSKENTIGAWYETSGKLMFQRCHIINWYPNMETARYGVGYIYRDCTFGNGNQIQTCNFSFTNPVGDEVPNVIIRVTNNKFRKHVLKVYGWIVWQDPEDNLMYGYVEGMLNNIHTPYGTLSIRPSRNNRNDSEWCRLEVFHYTDIDDEDFKWVIRPLIDHSDRGPDATFNNLKVFLTVECIKSNYILAGTAIDMNGVDTSYEITFDYDYALPTKEIPDPEDPSRTIEVPLPNVNINSYSIAHEDVPVPPEAGNLMLVGQDYLYATGNNKKYKLLLTKDPNINYTSISEITPIISGEIETDKKLAFLDWYGPIIINGQKVLNANGSLFSNTKLVYNKPSFMACKGYAGTLIIADEIDLTQETDPIDIDASRVGFIGKGALIGGTLKFRNTVTFDEGWETRITSNITFSTGSKSNNFGTTRPSNVQIGFKFFDTTLGTLGKPIWYAGNNVWIDGSGVEV